MLPNILRAYERTVNCFFFVFSPFGNLNQTEGSQQIYLKVPVIKRFKVIDLERQFGLTATKKIKIKMDELRCCSRMLHGAVH